MIKVGYDRVDERRGGAEKGEKDELYMVVFVFFFFQAEDGIRDVRT